MHLFCFASKNVENIRRGVEKKMWAVSTPSQSAVRGRVTKARRNFRRGSYGLLYCAETQSFTVPFVATSSADPNKKIMGYLARVLDFTVLEFLRDCGYRVVEAANTDEAHGDLAEAHCPGGCGVKRDRHTGLR